MSFSGTRLLEPDEVAAASMKLLSSNRILATVPRARGLTVPLMGLVPGLAVRLKPMIERRARRNRAAEARRQGGAT